MEAEWADAAAGYPQVDSMAVNYLTKIQNGPIIIGFVRRGSRAVKGIRL